MTAMSIVAHSHAFVVGVDTHARNHVYAIIAAKTGELVDTRDLPTTSAGIKRAIAWTSIDVFQVNRLRAEIIRGLASHPEGSTTGDVGHRIDVDYRQIHKHVRALATQGIVGSSISSPGTGRHILYTLSRSALESNNTELLDYLLGK